MGCRFCSQLLAMKKGGLKSLSFCQKKKRLSIKYGHKYNANESIEFRNIMGSIIFILKILT
jgi:hypothetical protein